MDFHLQELTKQLESIKHFSMKDRDYSANFEKKVVDTIIPNI